MDASVFSIGIYNAYKERIDFFGSKEKGKILPFHFDRLEQDSLSVNCLKNQREILITDFEIEYNLYFSEMPKPKTGELPEAIIYLPLTVKEKKIGVISIQSFQKNDDRYP